MHAYVFGEPFCILPVASSVRLRIVARWERDENCETEYDRSKPCRRMKYCGYSAIVEEYDGLDALGRERWGASSYNNLALRTVAQAYINERVVWEWGPGTPLYGVEK